VPYGSLNAPKDRYPLRRFPWKEVRESLKSLATVTNANDLVHLAYINPETGGECMPVLGFSAIMLRPGETATLARRSSSAVLHCIEGKGQAEIDGVTLNFDEADTMAVPTHAKVAFTNSSSKEPAFIFMVDDAPMQRRLGFFEIFE
jgi:gentisate 1,2-dioxygenase